MNELIYKYSESKTIIKPRFVAKPKKTHVLIVNLVAWGDVIISTQVVKALKEAHPDWRITYVTTKMCEAALHNNPDIDKIVPLDIKSRREAFKVWHKLVDEYRKSKEYDYVLVPWAGMTPHKYWRLIGSKRSSSNFMWTGPRMLQMLNIEFKPPLKTYLYHTPEEILKVSKFIKNINTKDHRLIMMETEGFSNQTWWNEDWTRSVIKLLYEKYPKLHIFISRGGPEPQYLSEIRSRLIHETKMIHYMNYFSIREMSILFNYCDMMFSVSSGTANTCMTHECKKGVMWFEVVKKVCSSIPMGIDGKTFWFKNDLTGFLKAVADRL